VATPAVALRRAGVSLATTIWLISDFLWMSQDCMMTNPIVLWVIIYSLALLLYSLLPNITLFPPLFHLSLIGYLFVPWLAWQILCFRANRQKFRSAKKITDFVQNGPYAVVRHPIYAADIAVFGVGIMVYTKLWFIVSVIAAAILLVLWARWEEKALREHFDKTYKAYMDLVPAFNPFPYLKATYAYYKRNGWHCTL
jgi:protein-S-isoprenylcysteine O-methyltransferase Ste14